MNFDVVNKAEILFQEIADFYFKWNIGPENIIPYLLENPSTKRRIDANERLRQKSTMQTIKKVEFRPVPFKVCVLPNINKLRFQKTPIVPERYRLSGQDINGWVYFARIVPLREEEFIPFCKELRETKTDAEERSRVDWLVSFGNLLNSLSQQLIALDSMPLSMTGEQEDWPDMDRTLHDLADGHVRPLVSKYENVIKKYVSQMSNDEEILDGLTNRERMLIHCYEQREVIKKGNPKYNDYITYATPSKRKAYPNGSANKAKYLIASIEKIMPKLSESAAQQARNELDTLRANI